MAKRKKKDNEQNRQRVEELMEHYSSGRQTVEQRAFRKGGWDDCVNAYMGRLPSDWPYQSMVVDPRIRTALLEKQARMINAKPRGKVVPRKGGSVVGAKINNFLLDLAWDQADRGGSMIEKLTNMDTTARATGAAFSLQYWDDGKGFPEMKVIDPHDIWFSYNATHPKNARWVQIREFVTISDLKARFGDAVKDVKDSLYSARENIYQDKVLQNRGLEDKLGTDPSNPVVEVITEFVPGFASSDGKGLETVFMPQQGGVEGHIIKERKLPNKDKKVTISMLRYYPLGNDIYGESEIEPVLSLWKGIQALLCGFVDEMNISMRPPLKVITGQVQKHTIEYGPGAIWVMNNPNAVTEAQIGANAIRNFQNSYPALVAAFNTAIGDSSLGISNITGRQDDKTATEVKALASEKSTRDSYNQVFMAEYLKEVMMQWHSMMKQFMFDKDDKPQLFHVTEDTFLIDLAEEGLDTMETPPAVYDEIADIVQEAPDKVTDDMVEETIKDTRLPKFPVKQKGKNVPKFSRKTRNAGELLVEKEDLNGLYEYIPDVKSMALGAAESHEEAKRTAFELSINPNTMAMLKEQGSQVDLKELLVSMLEDAGLKDAERLFTDAQQQPQQQPQAAGALPGGEAGAGQGPGPGQPPVNAGMEGAL